MFRGQRPVDSHSFIDRNLSLDLLFLYAKHCSVQSEAYMATPTTARRRKALTPDPVPPAIVAGDTVYLLVPVTVRQLSREGYAVINSMANLNKVANRSELRTPRELGL
jgi:hypothetical protein